MINVAKSNNLFIGQDREWLTYLKVAIGITRLGSNEHAKFSRVYLSPLPQDRM